MGPAEIEDLFGVLRRVPHYRNWKVWSAGGGGGRLEGVRMSFVCVRARARLKRLAPIASAVISDKPRQ